MTEAYTPLAQYQYSAPQAPVMSDFVTAPVSITSPHAYFSPLVSMEPHQQNLSPPYHYTLPNYNQAWPPTMSRFLPSPPVKIEPLEPGPNDHYQSQHGYAVGGGQNDRYISSRPYRPPSYHGRLHLQAPSNQMDVTQQQPTFSNQFGHVSNMTRTEQSYYNWQYQQQHAYQSSRTSMSSTMLDQNSSNNSGATMAPLDMKPSSPASSVSGGNGKEALADVSITLHPWTTQAQNTTLYASTTNLSSMGAFGTVQSTGRRYSSPPLASILWSSDDDPILPIEPPPVAALSLREIQSNPGTNWSDPLQNVSGSEHDLSDLSDSEDDADNSDDDAPHEQDDHDDYDHDNLQVYRYDKHDDAYDSDEQHSDDEDNEVAFPPQQPVGRIPSLFNMPAATSNLRNESANGISDLSKIKPKLPVYPTVVVVQRAAAKAASKRITALTKSTTVEPEIELEVKADVKKQLKPVAKASPAKKRVCKPRAPKTVKGQRRPLAVTSAAVCRVPAPIPNHNIIKRSRGRAVTTDPNAVDSNIVHVCPVPACGACFKRREHVKRHIRGLHTEDKPYECEYPGCASTFTRGDNLKGHYIKVHKTTIEKVYKRLDIPLMS